MSKNFKEGLVEAIKAAGQMIIDNADDIAGKTEYMSNLELLVTFDQEMNSIPELTITRSHLPNREKLSHILSTFRGEKRGEEVKEMDIATIECCECGKTNKKYPHLKFYVVSQTGKTICEKCAYPEQKK